MRPFALGAVVDGQEQHWDVVAMQAEDVCHGRSVKADHRRRAMPLRMSSKDQRGRAESGGANRLLATALDWYISLKLHEAGALARAGDLLWAGGGGGR